MKKHLDISEREKHFCDESGCVFQSVSKSSLRAHKRLEHLGRFKGFVVDINLLMIGLLYLFCRAEKKARLPLWESLLSELFILRARKNSSREAEETQL